MKAIFIGSVEFSVSLLEIVKRHPQIKIVGLVTKEKSSFNSDFVDLSLSFQNTSKPDVFYYKSESEDLTSWVRKKSPDVIFCLGWSHLLPEAVLATPPMGTIGYHPAALPNNRGRHPIIWALCLGLQKTSSTFFKITPGVDEGDILSQADVPISDTDYAQDLYNKLMSVAERQLKELLDQIVQGTVQAKSQKGLPSNYWRKRSKEDGRIDWRMPAKSIYNLVRALAPPYPGAFFQVADKNVAVTKTQIVSGSHLANRIPGEVIEVANGFIDIKTADDLIRIEAKTLEISVQKGDFL